MTLRVFRHRGFYFTSSSIFGHSYSTDSPGFADFVRSSIPHESDAFSQWLQEQRGTCDQSIQSGIVKNFNGDSGTMLPTKITKDRPTSGDTRWTCELDLDNLVFSINGMPLFRLDCMPPQDIFLRCIGFDSYGHRAFTKHTPLECRYSWKTAPPLVDDNMVATYLRFTNGIAPRSINDLLGITQFPSNGERVRIGLMEILIGNFISLPTAGYSLRLLEMCASRDEIPEILLTIGSSFTFCATSPVMYMKPGMLAEEQNVKLTRDFSWPRCNICVIMSTHLDDPRNLQASLVQLAVHIMAKPDVSGIVYGVAFSIFHCSILCINKNTGFFTHTPALQFLPSSYATSPSTPGITALARLGHTPDPAMHVFAKARQIVLNRWQADNRNQDNFVKRFMAKKKLLDTPPQSTPLLHFHLPVEIMHNVAMHINDMQDLVHFSLVSYETLSAGASVLRAPHIADYRLVEYMPVEHDVPMDSDEDDEKELTCSLDEFYRIQGNREPYLHLYQGFFKATDHEGQIVLLKIGNLPESERTGTFELPFINGPRGNGNITIGYQVVTAEM